MSESSIAKPLTPGPSPRTGATGARSYWSCVGSLVILLAIACCHAPAASAVDVDPLAASEAAPKTNPSAVIADAAEPEPPWDFSPYRVLIWIVSDDPKVSADTLRSGLNRYLDRDFLSIWRTTIADAPPAVATAARRNMAGMSFESITASDPVIAVKKNHPDAIRIRVASNVAQYVSRVAATKGRLAEIKRLAESAGNPTLDGVGDRLESIEGDAIALHQLWSLPEEEGLLVSRGTALTLTEPEAKLIALPIGGFIFQMLDDYDKVFVVRIEQQVSPSRVSVVQYETLMRYFGAVTSRAVAGPGQLIKTIGLTVTESFSPTIRIENAGQKSASGLLRAGGLIVDEGSPAMIHVGDVLMPLTRKNDRNGKPILIGPLDWSYLLVKEVNGVRQEMDYHTGRPGGLQGRQNQRTFRIATKVRPRGDQTTIRLHARGNEDFPLIGYEIYERELESPKMTFVGRTDWNGRMNIQRTKDPLRLFYVKNGGAVLARLPVVPGLIETEVADLSGDDMRLQAEAYIRGVQNAIVDLVAIRQLFAARVRLRLEKGEMEEAEQLLSALREQPTNEKLANDMGKKETDFLRLIGPKNASQYRKVENMFSTTRDMLSQHINPRIINELETDLLSAKRNGGKLPKRSAGRDSNSADKTPPAARAKKSGNGKQKSTAKEK